MAYIRKLPSGLHAATIRTPAGRITQSFDLRSAAKEWAADQESQVRRGEWIDPRRAKTTVGEWWERCRDSRHLEKASRARDESHWRCHVRPRWARVPLGAVLKTDVSGWVVSMQRAGVGAATIEGCVGVLIALYDLAIEAEMVRTNPARRVKKPRRDAHVDRVLSPDEETRLLAALDRLFPGRVDARLFVELMLDTGMRWEEAAAVPPPMVDTRRQRISVAWVMERDGTVRPYAKSEAGNRSVAYGDALAARLRAAKLAAREVPAKVFPPGGPGRLVFTTPGGGVVRYSNWHDRIWQPALYGLPARAGVKGHAPRSALVGALLDDPQPSPHDCRHTYGSRQADDGVPVHDIMALMGHADIRSAQRYMHSGEARFERSRAANRRARSS